MRDPVEPGRPATTPPRPQEAGPPPDRPHAKERSTPDTYRRNGGDAHAARAAAFFRHEPETGPETARRRQGRRNGARHHAGSDASVVPAPALAPAPESASERPITAPDRLLPPPAREPGLSHLHLSELLTETARKATRLARKEMELAQVDAKAEMRQGAKMAAGFGVGGLCALLTLVLLLVAVVFALIEAGLPGWAASLIVAGVVLLVGTVASLVGWRKRLQNPMATTRRSLQESVRWAKELR
jgi:hypothetical protein